MTQEQPQIISNTVFGFTLAVVIVCLVGVLFPALIVGLIYDLSIQVEPFEFGIWMIPFLTANLILLGFGIIYYKKILPGIILQSIKFVLRFEVSRRVATIVLVVLLGIYIGFSLGELANYEGDKWADFSAIEVAIEEFPYNEYRGNVSIVYVKNFLLWVSHNILGNIRILPFIGSISLLLLTYFFTVQLTKKRFAGIVAFIVLMQSATFLKYDTSATYSFFWILFYLLSLHLITSKRWYLSHIIYIFSLFSKPMTILFLPFTVFFIYNAKMPSKRKIFIIIPYAVLVGAVLSLHLAGIQLVSAFLPSFDYGYFWMAFSFLSVMIRDDGFILVFLLPLVVGLFLISRRGIKHADSILLLIMGTLLSHPLLVAFTSYDIHPYRYIPFIVFFAVGVGTLFSKKVTESP